MQWFEVDKQGLAKILERKGKAFVLFELVSNAWDENASEVDVTLERIAGSRNVRLTVRDSNPTGFADLRHTFLLFAKSAKKDEAGKRGRFNISWPCARARRSPRPRAPSRSTLAGATPAARIWQPARRSPPSCA